nr:winged helix-turn-helix domain-containing protein [Mangrovicoccus ximenensis]
MPVEKLEKERGWPARSAKQVLKVILDALIEIGGGHAEREDRSEEIEFLTGAPEDHVRWRQEFGIAPIEARVFAALHADLGKVVLKDTLLRRAYWGRIDEAPSLKMIDVSVCKLRAKLTGRAWAIETVWGTGYRLTEVAAWDGETLAWYAAHTVGEMSLRAVAREHGVHASTVMRRLNGLMDRLSEAQEAELDAAAAEWWATAGG